MRYLELFIPLVLLICLRRCESLTYRQILIKRENITDSISSIHIQKPQDCFNIGAPHVLRSNDGTITCRCIDNKYIFGDATRPVLCMNPLEIEQNIGMYPRFIDTYT